MLHVNDFHELVNRILSVFLYIDLKEQIFINKNQKPVKFKKKKNKWKIPERDDEMIVTSFSHTGTQIHTYIHV